MNSVLAISFSLLMLVNMSAPKPVSKKEDLPNFFKVNDHLYRGGQPSEEGIRKLAQLGVKTIVNFRDPDGKVLREKELAEQYGMRFFNPHLSNWFKPKDKSIEEILELILNRDNQPVFIHCKRGADRTGTVVAVYRMKIDGWDERRAYEEAKQFKLGWWQFWMKDYIHDYYKKLKKSKPA